MKRILFFFVLIMFLSEANCQYIIDIAKIEDKEAIRNYNGDVNIRDSNGATPLMWAIYYGDLELVELLLSKGASPYLKGHIHIPDSPALYGSCMAVAAGQNKLEILQYLVEKVKIPIDDKELGIGNQETGWTALQWAAYNGNNEIIKYLVKKKAKINEPSIDDSNYTALHFATDNRHVETVKLLAKLKAKKNLESSYGDTALDLALGFYYNMTMNAIYGEPEIELALKSNKEIILYMVSAGYKSSKYSAEQISEIISKFQDE